VPPLADVIRRSIVASRSTVVLSVVSAALLLIVLLLPDLAKPLSGPSVVTAYHGRITALLDPHRPDPAGQGGGFLPDARVRLLEGPNADQEVEAYLQGPGGQQDSNAYRVGEDVVVTFTRTADGSEMAAVSDRWRLPQLALLGIVFVVAVVLVGGWRGVRALLALALTIAIILRILIPLLVNGVPPIPVAIVLATAITILAIALTEGLSPHSVAAILGTAGALALTALLAAIVTSVAGFTNTLGSDLVFLQLPDGAGLDLRGLLLAAFMIGAIGVLDDVTVTQAAAVEQLSRQAGLSGRRLYASAFAVGRSHIAATVNTLFLAYAGASLPLLVLFAVGGQPTTMLLNGEAVSIEIVRTLVGSLGIVAAVPLTTVIAVWLTARTPVTAATQDRAATQGRAATLLRRPPVTLVAGLLIVAGVTLVATLAVSPLLGSAPRRPLTPDQFGCAPPGGSASPGASAPESLASATPEPSASGDMPIFAVGEAIPLFDASGTLGHVTVVSTDVQPAGSGTGVVVLVEIRYAADRDLVVDPTAWVGVRLEGEVAAHSPPAGKTALAAGGLKAGQSRTGWLAFDVPDAADTLLLDYRLFGTTLFSVQLY
jgi:uncharacterized membrane protein